MSRREIDFTSKRKMFIIISVILVLVSLISIFTRGFNFGVDFSGGTDLVFSSTEDLTVAELREKLADIDAEFGMAKISRLNDIQSDESIKSNFSVTVQEFYKSDDKDALLERLPDGLKVESFDSVSGFAADELRSKSIWIAIIALGIILVYITFRFK
ncbi:MAG TPA: protein translocase subunit SecF, partial [Thermotogota bacterium]|nr:protein translocase subunit SecF [Thermotogota bacterium]HPR96142.1 protein translocase subunit SecF [Thermotogota bacterium]